MTASSRCRYCLSIVPESALRWRCPPDCLTQAQPRAFGDAESPPVVRTRFEQSSPCAIEGCRVIHTWPFPEGCDREFPLDAAARTGKDHHVAILCPRPARGDATDGTLGFGPLRQGRRGNTAHGLPLDRRVTPTSAGAVRGYGHGLFAGGIGEPMGIEDNESEDRVTFACRDRRPGHRGRRSLLGRWLQSCCVADWAKCCWRWTRSARRCVRIPCWT